MAKTYIGERYVPLIDGPWSNTKAYERLTQVTFEEADAVSSYLARQDVPAGTPLTNTDYWILIYKGIASSGGGGGTVSWVDITDKPTSYPPETHTQDWTTITGRPATFPPASHTQGITTINGLSTSLADLQAQIDAIQPGGGTEVTSAVIALRQIISVTNTSATITPFNSIIRTAQPGNAAWQVTSGGLMGLANLGDGTYDIYMSGSMYITTFATSTAARMFTIRSNVTNVLYTFYVNRETPTVVLPDTYVGTVTAANNPTLGIYYQFQNGDVFGLTSATILRDFITLKAIRRG